MSHLSVLSGNLAQLLATVLIGVALCFVLFRKASIGECAYLGRGLSVVWWGGLIYIAGSVIFCFLLDVGETYRYSEWYKRSFAFFGDGFPIFLTLFLAYSFFSKSGRMMFVVFLTLLLVGGRAVILLNALCLFLLVRGSPAIFGWKQVVRIFAMALVSYFALMGISNILLSQEVKLSVANFVFSDKITLSTLGKDVCEVPTGCINTQIKQPIKQRFATAAAGVWMMMHGGVSGAEYPSNAYKFADFVMVHNPFGINEIFNMSWADWMRAGAVQNPYLKIGSGYGLFAFLLVVFVFFYTSYIGYRNLSREVDRSQLSAFTVFFIVNAVGNQTQEWMHPWSVVLLASGFAMAHIWCVELLMPKRKLMVDG